MPSFSKDCNNQLTKKCDCGYGYSGYAYRICENGVLGEIHMDKCVYERPRNIHYGKSEYELVVGIE